MDVGSAVQSARRGDVLGTLGNAAMAGIGAVPVVGDAARAAVKAVRRVPDVPIDEIPSLRRLRIPDIEWWGSHGGSKAITGAAAQRMGLDPRMWKYSTSNTSHRVAQALLGDIAQEGRQARSPLFSGRELPKSVEYREGDIIRLPTTATSGDKKYAMGYATHATDPRNQEWFKKIGREVGTPWLYRFPEDTPITPFHVNSPQARQEMMGRRDIGPWDEAITAGEFRVERVGEDVDTSPWWKPKVRTVDLSPVRVFDPVGDVWRRY